MSSITEKPGNPSPRDVDDDDDGQQGRRRGAPVQKALIDLAEMIPASSSAWLMTWYMNQLNAASRPPDSALLKSFGADPPALAPQLIHLGACVVFGCSTASFLHRRQLQDPNQPFIFAACVSVGAVAGGCTGAGADYVMLVHVSWAVCLAMLASVVALRIRGCGHPRTSASSRGIRYNPGWVLPTSKHTF